MAEAWDFAAIEAERRVGGVVGGYRLDALLGIGGMAAVYRATHARDGSTVAIKMLHRPLSAADDVRTRFLREGYVANRVDHAGAVRVLDDDVASDGSVFLVMELLAGETLAARWIAAGRVLGAREVTERAAQLLSVLEAAHAHGIIHRDVKPENLFVTTDGALKVLDFGIARLRDAGVGATRAGETLGTAGFMPPEQALGLHDQVDERTDLWAVGATMFALLTGRLVHDGTTAEQVLVCTATRPVSPVREVRADVPEAVARIVDRALAFDRAARWESARAMREALVEAHARTFGEPLSAPARARITPLPRKRRFARGAALAVGVVLLGSLVGLAAERLTRPSPPEPQAMPNRPR
jgi:serine/threonine-protein kinase